MIIMELESIIEEEVLEKDQDEDEGALGGKSPVEDKGDEDNGDESPTEESDVDDNEEVVIVIVIVHGTSVLALVLY